ncbi:hypothetical protein OE88DRAFT_1744863 [Heliocybe sulcata]|uniref:Anaphase-promoting complex subunit 4 n=1 Tax=Heliocybe sulcata TaxID=5364 RepID=A0A5C3NK89_9AGAM|nr:hypothetical protein OE88DRAFT_1744863 [Heliocybe sulcata]
MNLDASSIVPLATLRFPSASRVLRCSCCPDKDLAIFVSRHGTRDRLSLWKLQGSRKWEIDIDVEGESNEVVDLAWGPDGQTIAVAHNPPRITLHSMQDGRIERSYVVESHAARRPFLLTSVWWIRNQTETQANNLIPDIFKRDNVITGSSQSLLRMLPLLDALKDDVHPLTASDLFVFQGNESRSEAQTKLPATIASWPILPSSLLLASIQSSSKHETSRPGQELDEVDNSNTDSIVVVAADTGHLHLFLEGWYPLGSSLVSPDLCTTALHWDRNTATYFTHGQATLGDAGSITQLRPAVVQLPLLKTRYPRDVASASSAARELVWYAMCVVKEMRESWFGSDANVGARELGPKWIRSLETRQKEGFGQDEPNAVVDLTSLLVTGRASEALTDFLGSGEQMSDRGIQKWESTVSESLTKLRDFSEKRLAPACQRLHLILEEVRGWSKLPQHYGLFGFRTSDVDGLLDLVARTIVISAWLAATARREARRFKEFITWIRYENAHITQSGEGTPPALKHDFLEVNNYLMSGLVVSPIDKWFMGPVPRFSALDLGVSPGKHSLKEVMGRARRTMEDPERMAWQQSMRFKDLSHLDRNLESIVQDISVRCVRLFHPAAYATGHSAIISHGLNTSSTLSARSSLPKEILARERTIKHDDQKDGDFVEYLAMQTPPIADTSFLCLARTCYGHDVAETALRVDVAILECRGPGESGSQEAAVMRGSLLDFDFFDESELVVVYRAETSGKAFIATVNYSDVDYQPLTHDGYVSAPTREDLMIDALQKWRDKQLRSVLMPINRCRELAGCRQGSVSLAVNGRVGRRVACVLEDSGLIAEVMDMEGDPQEPDVSENIDDGTEE